MKVDTNQQKIDEILTRGTVVDILPSKKAFVEALQSGRRLRIYHGIDATSTSLHLSHAKNILLLNDLRKLGHEIILLIGDFTAQVGDPTGNSETRKQLTPHEVRENVKKIRKQVSPLIPLSGFSNPAKIEYNSRWLSGLKFGEILGLASNFTLQQMVERDMFAKRIADKKPVHLHEFLYPLMQGYDSVALETDVEIGGTDQLFNMLAGKTLLKRIKNKDKFVLTVSLMENPKTGELMSKSRGVGVFLDSSPDVMFGQIMAQGDEMVKLLLVNNTRIPLGEIEKIVTDSVSGGDGARNAKLTTAEEIVSIHHSREAAKKARQVFLSRFSDKDLSTAPEIRLPYKEGALYQVIVDSGLASSNTEAKRLIEDGAVEVDGNVVKDPFKEIETSGVSLRVGKHRFARLIS